MKDLSYAGGDVRLIGGIEYPAHDGKETYFLINSVNYFSDEDWEGYRRCTCTSYNH